MPSFTSLADYPKIEPLATTPAKLIALIRDKPMDFEPGEKWLYDNSGYVLLTYVIEKVRGDSYEKFVRESIFAPLGMTDSGYDSNSAIIPRRASGYSPGRGGVENAGFIHMTVPQGAGALYSTTGDLPKMGAGSIRRQGAQAGFARRDDHAASLHAESESVVVLEPDDNSQSWFWRT